MVSGMGYRKVVGFFLIAIFATTVLARNAYAVDLAPLDGVAPPPGVKGASIALGYRLFDEAYVAGVKQPTEVSLRARTAALRVGTYVPVDRLPGYFYADFPYVELDGNDGVGDVALAGAVWPYANKESGTYFGIAGYLVLPTGNYDVENTLGLNRNPSGNRAVGALQTGLNQRLYNRFNLQVAVDVAVFEDNDEYFGSSLQIGTFEQRSLVSWQAALSYQWSRAFATGVSYFDNAGGEVRTHGGPWSGEVQNERVGLWVRAALSPRMTVALNYKQAIDIQNGLSEADNIQFRIARYF